MVVWPNNGVGVVALKWLLNSHAGPDTRSYWQDGLPVRLNICYLTVLIRTLARFPNNFRVYVPKKSQPEDEYRIATFMTLVTRLEAGGFWSTFYNFRP